MTPTGTKGAQGGWTIAAVLCAAAAAACLTAAAALPDSTPPPVPPSALTANPPTGRPPQPPTPAPQSAPIAPSPPDRVDVPATGLDTSVEPTSLALDGTVRLPADPLHAAWTQTSAAPGTPGATVIAGHVDSTHGPAAFYGLGALRPGMDIAVHRRDGTTAHFTADRIAVYPKDRFPAATVYSPTATATLRLITCTGWSASTRAYTDNLVVYAHLARLEPAPARTGPHRDARSG